MYYSKTSVRFSLAYLHEKQRIPPSPCNRTCWKHAYSHPHPIILTPNYPSITTLTDYKSSDLGYQIRCTKRNAFYIGGTSQMLSKHMIGHQSNCVILNWYLSIPNTTSFFFKNAVCLCNPQTPSCHSDHLPFWSCPLPNRNSTPICPPIQTIIQHKHLLKHTPLCPFLYHHFHSPSSGTYQLHPQFHCTTDEKLLAERHTVPPSPSNQSALRSSFQIFLR